MNLHVVHIYGIDIDPQCSQFAEGLVDILIGNQEDRNFLNSIAQAIPRIDILVDDGGHTMKQQTATFVELYSRLDPNGVYLCEDVHTSYWDDYGRGYQKSGPFIEYSNAFTRCSPTKKIYRVPFCKVMPG